LKHSSDAPRHSNHACFWLILVQDEWFGVSELFKVSKENFEIELVDVDLKS
jgi:hypothetical protein